MTGVSGRDREDAISNLFVDTSRSKMAFSRIDELMTRGWEASFCRALLILGPSRCGKTHIFTEWLRRRRETEPLFKAVVTEVPQGCSLRQMAAQLLENLGDPDPDYGSQGEKTRRIAQLATGYDVIVIDELQRLVDDNTGKVKKDVSGWLTNLLNRRLCPLLLVGELHADLILQGNMYLVGRTLGQVSVAPYNWHDDQERLEFRVFLDLECLSKPLVL
jgi:predicted AAA+ superfamily ATPase